MTEEFLQSFDYAGILSDCNLKDEKLKLYFKALIRDLILFFTDEENVKSKGEKPEE